MQYLTSGLADALRRTIEKLEENNAPDDPSLAEIKRRALLRLADMQEPPERRRVKLLVLQPQSPRD